jgi:hypothetical protein
MSSGKKGSRILRISSLYDGEPPWEVIRRLEERVDELDKERRQARFGLVSSPTERMAADERYKEAVDRLRALDPNSAYLP